MSMRFLPLVEMTLNEGDLVLLPLVVEMSYSLANSLGRRRNLNLILNEISQSLNYLFFK